ncbi:MAG: transglutaminase family protein [Bacteroidia bacterium]|nr:transglutaminase family protein [Bacteroidia bacterium]
MTHRKELPFLLTLLEDNSSVVREVVVSALREFGPGLSVEVAPYLRDLGQEAREVLDLITASMPAMPQSWLDWLDIEHAATAHEDALTRLSVMTYGQEALRIGPMLDELAVGFLAWAEAGSVPELMEFIFQQEGFSPPRERDYSPLYDDLYFVLRHKQGTQIALSSIAMLVASRVGLEVHGISIQGNFMVITLEGQQMQMYNTFNKGRALARASILYIEEAFRRNRLSPRDMKAQVYEIVQQVLANAIEITRRKGQDKDYQRYSSLYEELTRSLRSRDANI